MVGLQSFAAYVKKFKKSPNEFASVGVAILSDSSSQYLVKAMVAAGIENKLNLSIYEAPYNQIYEELVQQDSPVFDASVSALFLLTSQQKLYKKFLHTPTSQRIYFAQNHLQYLQQLGELARSRSNAALVFCNYPDVNDEVFGNFANSHPASFPYQLRQLNVLLMEWVSQTQNIYLADLASLVARYGHANVMDNRLYLANDVVFALDFLPAVARALVQMVAVVKGNLKKCLILDLDNTMWGGIIGDDGLESIELGDLGNGKAFVALQHWAKQLMQRGIILAVCSKNEAVVAREPFEKHPDMVLRMDDISVFVANWENKADNIRYIQKVLNIGFDSMVFVDDNPFERQVVRQELPDVTVPELPDDPVEYLPFLQALRLFETTTFTTEDAGRTELYKAEAQRQMGLSLHTNYDAYLESLSIEAEVTGFVSQVVPRVAQLSQRSNQFNLRTIRYTEASASELAHSPHHTCLAVRLLDQFGDYGIIGIVVLKRNEDDALFIENWMMSCRVLKRGVEDMVLNLIVEAAQELGCKTVIGEYLPTKKNGMVKDHYKGLGFSAHHDGSWHLKTEGYVPRKHFITIKKN
ncbi:MAG: HAD-IIIC family phosphatase [Bacteroidetes bacterium]|nr:MAG: HAD-IIIC family phosphatase [Bacteroidota bacterium]